MKVLGVNKTILFYTYALQYLDGRPWQNDLVPEYQLAADSGGIER
jgi:hypothetical protein